MGSPSLQRANGVYIGTGAAFDISLDFTPTRVKIYSVTENSESVKTDRMVGVNFLLADLAAGTVTKVTANGITLGVRNINIGTNADINTSASEYYWVADE